jgi:molybdopterin molybdotransferase
MDLVPGILKELGVVEVFHKVAVKPGKPIWFGVSNREGRKQYVFGLPGNPVSSLVGFHLFVRRAIEKMLGSRIDHLPTEYGELNIPHETRGNRPTFWPGKRVFDDQTIRRFEPLVWRGSSDLFALGEAEGLIRFPENSVSHPAGEKVQFFPFV